MGHARIARAIHPTGVATGEVCQNRVIFKQLLQAEAIGFCQVDSCRLAGVNEVLAVMLMAAKFGVPVCPHAGGVGLCEYVQHLALIDYICISGSLENRILEYVDHLHEHFVDPVVLFLTDNGPQQVRYNAGMLERKGSVHEGGIRVPFFVRWPGKLKPGLEVSEFAAVIDIAPTILEICGAPRPAGVRMGGIAGPGRWLARPYAICPVASRGHS